MSLPRIDINNPNFKNAVYEGLLKKRGVVITNIGEDFNAAVENLYKAYDDFLLLPEVEQKKYSGQENGFSGFYAANRYHYGGKTTNRFFITRGDSNQLTHELPKPVSVKKGMAESSEEVQKFTGNIIQQVCEAIESGLQIQPGELSKYFAKGSLFTMNQYEPTTQEKLKAMFQSKQLSFNKQGNISAFEKHKDFSLISMLIYRHNITDGLRLGIPNEEDKVITQSIDLRNDQQIKGTSIIVMSGKLLQELTSNKLKGLTHQVETVPLEVGQSYMRYCISIFQAHNDENLEKLIEEHKEQETKTVINFSTFFEENRQKVMKRMEHMLAKEFPVAQSKQYPTQNEINRSVTDEGIIFTRIKPS